MKLKLLVSDSQKHAGCGSVYKETEVVHILCIAQGDGEMYNVM